MMNDPKRLKSQSKVYTISKSAIFHLTDYSIIKTRTFRHEKLGRVYTFGWDVKQLTIEGCIRLLKEFNYRDEKYIEITNALINE